MRRFAILLLVLLVLLAFTAVLPGEQIALAESGWAQKPPPPATPAKEPKSPPLPPSPTPGKPSVPPTPLPKPAVPSTPKPSPTLPPTPTAETHETFPTPTATIAATLATSQRDAVVLPSPTAVPTLLIVTGQVFDDRNGNGTQDRDENGVGGVPVMLNGQVVGATDASGQFAAQSVSPGALLTILPPQGWQWLGKPVPADTPGRVAVPLRRTDAPNVFVTTTAAGTVTGGVVAVVLALLALNSFAMLSQGAAVRALERTYRRHKSQELELTIASEINSHRERLHKSLEDNPDAWRAMATQLFTEAGLGQVTPSSIQHVAAAPYPVLAITGTDDSLYVLTTDTEHLTQRGRVIPLDAGVSLFARVEAHVLWDAAMKRDGGRVVPLHEVAWYLVIPRQSPSVLRPRKSIRSWIGR